MDSILAGSGEDLTSYPTSGTHSCMAMHCSLIHALAPKLHRLYSCIKRKEHGLETWALFIDLVKAFDSVPRETLFAVLRRYGMPDHFVKVLIRLHCGAKVKVKIGEVDSEIDSTIGVRQGSCEGPVLFLFIMQAAMETLEWPEGVSKPELTTREYGKTTGEREPPVCAMPVRLNFGLLF